MLEHALSSVAQSLSVVLLGWAAGARYPGGPGGIAVLTAATLLLCTGFGALSTAVGMLARRRETLIGLSSVLLLPLSFLSSAFMAEKLMPRWIRGLAACNPVNWALDAGRPALAGTADWHAVLGRCGLLLIFAVVMVRLAGLTFRAYQKSV
ncbi:MAG TPA: ABC transporter permease [Actinospica sp.]|nr:ABC transporter permease [Actinospica sp.]